MSKETAERLTLEALEVWAHTCPGATRLTHKDVMSMIALIRMYLRSGR